MLCEICNSDKRVFFNKKFNGFLCDKHRGQINKYGEIKNRTAKDPNNILIFDDCAKVELYDKNGHIRNYAIIDVEDIDVVSKYKWSEANSGYSTTQIGYKDILLMHRLVMKVSDKNLEVDHIDRNRLNNRKENLRIANRQNNARNTKVSTLNTSGVSGVVFDKERNKWKSQVFIKRKRVHDKRHNLFDEAVSHRIINESIYYKEFSPNYNLQTNTIQLTYHSHDDNKQTFIEVDMEGNIIKFEKLS